MSFETAGYQLLPVLPELVLAVGSMVLLMLGAYRGPQTTGLVIERVRTSTDTPGVACSET